MDKTKKAHILNAKFGTTNWRIWFMSDDADDMDRKWKEALKGLNELGERCSSPHEFYIKTINHFQSFGFCNVKN